MAARESLINHLIIHCNSMAPLPVFYVPKIQSVIQFRSLWQPKRRSRNDVL
jgi:hypothetical protein